MEYTVSLAVSADRPLTRAALLSVAQIGGVACGDPGRRRLETTLTVSAPTAPQAAKVACRRVTGRVPARVLAVEVMTAREADRRLRAG